MTRRSGQVAKLLADVVDHEAIDGDAPPAAGESEAELEPESERAESAGSDRSSAPNNARRFNVKLVAAVVLMAALLAVVVLLLRPPGTRQQSNPSASGSAAGPTGKAVLTISPARLVAQDIWGDSVVIARLAADGRVNIDGNFVGTLHADGRFVARNGQLQWTVDPSGVITRPSGQLVPFMFKEGDILVEPQANRQGHIDDNGVVHSPWGKQARSEGCVPQAKRTCLLLIVVSLTLPPDVLKAAATIEFCGAKYSPTNRSVACRDEKWTDLSPLTKMPDLRSVVLAHTAVVDLKPLASLKELRVLDLGNTPVSDLAPLAALPRLRLLKLNGTKVSDLAALSKLGELQLLALTDTPVNDLSALSSLPALRRLNVHDTKISKVDLDAFAKKHPKVELTR